MAHHTATHILQNTLRLQLGNHIQQQGSYVCDKYLRFDFSHPKALTLKEKIGIEKEINKKIRECSEVKYNNLTKEEAKNLGALSFFEEKYGDIVRVVSIGEYSKEFCGGTHIKNTGEIGYFKIQQESSVAQGIRRIEASVSKASINKILENDEIIFQITQEIRTSADNIIDKIIKQKKKIKQLEKEKEQIQIQQIKSNIQDILEQIEIIDGNSLLKYYFSNGETIIVLKKVLDILKQKHSKSIILLSSLEERSILIFVSREVIKEKGIKANDLIRIIAEETNGRGGGQEHIAQLGGADKDKIKSSINKVYQEIKEKI